jgi:tetratricopeptide (TPR) repeat protein
MKLPSRNLFATVTMVVAVAIVVVLGAVVEARHQSRVAGLRRPDRDGEIVERVPRRALDPVARSRALLRKRLALWPRDMEAATGLARLEIEEARRNGDPRSLGYAEAALRPWAGDEEAPPSVLLLRATISQSRHQFDEALQDLDRLLARAPDESQAWLTRALVLSVQGRYAEALASCAALEKHASRFAQAACRAPIEGLTGRARRAAAALVVTLEETTTPTERAFGHGLLGELARWTGDDAEAERQFGLALAEEPTDAYTRAALADLLLDANRPEEAAALVSAYTRDDGLLLRLALAEAVRGSVRAPAVAAELRERFAASRRRGDSLHGREEARFVLWIEGDASRALELARANWALQREPADARVLLESASAAKTPEAAAPVLAWLDESQFEWPRLQEQANGLRRAP